MVKKVSRGEARKARIFTQMFRFFRRWGKKETNLLETWQLPDGYCACEMRIDSTQSIKCRYDNCAKSYITSG